MEEAACRRRNGDGRGSAASITTKEHRTMTQPPSSSEILNWFKHTRLTPSEVQELESYRTMTQTTQPTTLPTAPQLNDPFLSLKRRQMPVKGTRHKTTLAYTITCDEATLQDILSAIACDIADTRTLLEKPTGTTQNSRNILEQDLASMQLIRDSIRTQLQELST